MFSYSYWNCTRFRALFVLYWLIFKCSFCLSNLDIDECLDTPCNNGGSCTNNGGGYSCSCTAEWTGKLCDEGKNISDSVVFRIYEIIFQDFLLLFRAPKSMNYLLSANVKPCFEI